jgi:hypothetical protein
MNDDMTTGEAEAWRAGWRAAMEAAAREADCGCPPKRKAAVLKHPPNSAARWNACGNPNCATIDAAAIRAMEPPA